MRAHGQSAISYFSFDIEGCGTPSLSAACYKKSSTLILGNESEPQRLYLLGIEQILSASAESHWKRMQVVARRPIMAHAAAVHGARDLAFCCNLEIYGCFVLRLSMHNKIIWLSLPERYGWWTRISMSVPARERSYFGCWCYILPKVLKLRWDAASFIGHGANETTMSLNTIVLSHMYGKLRPIQEQSLLKGKISSSHRTST